MDINEIRQILPHGSVAANEPMQKHTTFRVGGPAAFYARPADTDELAALLRFLRQKEVPYFVIGNGSNLLVSDSGYDGVIIDLGKNDGTSFTMLGIDDGMGEDSGCAPDEVLFDAGAGCLMASIGRYARDYQAAGFEALWGIPGCVGGACVMNAGAYGSEMKDVLCSVTVVDQEGNVQKKKASSVRFSYRTTSLLEEGLIVARAEIVLKKGDPKEISEKMEEYRRRRQEKQPLEYPSAGSTFKRPEGHFAGQLIDEAGLRGLTIGGAQVSEKHAGFIVNRGGATASDIYRLIRTVQEKVEAHAGISLVPEVRMLGDFRKSTKSV